MSDEFISLSDIMRLAKRTARKEQLGVDYFLSDLVGKTLVIVNVNPVDGIITIEENGVTKKVFTNSRVVRKKLDVLANIFKSGKGIKVTALVVEKFSKNGQRYIDLK